MSHRVLSSPRGAIPTRTACCKVQWCEVIRGSPAHSSLDGLQKLSLVLILATSLLPGVFWQAFSSVSNGLLPPVQYLFQGSYRKSPVIYCTELAIQRIVPMVYYFILCSLQSSWPFCNIGSWINVRNMHFEDNAIDYIFMYRGQGIQEGKWDFWWLGGMWLTAWSNAH